MPRIPAGLVTESGNVIPSEPGKQPKAKKKPPVPHDWKMKAKEARERKKRRDGR